jgi:hypothetical protein
MFVAEEAFVVSQIQELSGLGDLQSPDDRIDSSLEIIETLGG